MSKLSREREAELSRALEDERSLWRAAEDRGQPVSDADKVFRRVFIELTCVSDEALLNAAIATHAQEWMHTKNPYYIDNAVYLCSLAKVEPTETINALVADVARLRLKGLVRGGTPEQIDRQRSKSFALDFMAALCAAGETREIAASKAAQRLKDAGSPTTYTASSLEKFYSTEWRNLERARREHFSTKEGAAALDFWKRLIPDLPLAPPELKGERR